MSDQPQLTWTTGVDEFGNPDSSPVCRYTRINLVAADAANDTAVGNEEGALDEFINGNKARESVQPAGQFGLLTGHYPDFMMAFYTQAGAELLMQSPVWNPGEL